MELFLSRDGRIGRQKFWIGFILLTILSILILLILYFVVSTIFIGFLILQPEVTLIGIQILALLIVLWPSICVYGKRFHDRNKSAWWIMIAFIPLIGATWMLIELGFLRGTQGSNDYGDDPLG